MKFYRAITVALAASGTVSGASIAAVAQGVPAPVNPYAVIGVYGSPAAAQVACGNAATSAAVGTAAAAAAAAATQVPGTGCVLPVVDGVPALSVEQAAVSGPVVGTNLLPLLLGLAGVAGFAAYIASLDDDGYIDVPTPVSPV